MVIMNTVKQQREAQVYAKISYKTVSSPGYSYVFLLK